jgi:periplasmic protein TonB
MANVAPGPANSCTQSTSREVILGRFAASSAACADLRDNLSELFKPSVRGAIRSGLLVQWEPRGGNFRRNLRDAILSPFLIPFATGARPSAVPEIWSKQTLLKRLQSLSLSYHIVLLAFVVAPFLPELMVPSTTQAKNGPWARTPLVAPFEPAPATATKAPHGGGSGGERDSLPATKGRVPVFRYIQLAPPSVRPPESPILAVPPTLIGDPELRVKSPDMPNWGNPESAFTNASSGPSQGGGIGDASGGGIGNGGDGPGLGPGKGGGTGGDEFMAGSHGNGFPVCIYCPNPQYSEEAVKTKYQGVVMLLVTITADGRVTNIRVSKGLGVGLDEMAIAAVRTWRFKPALGPDNEPVTVNAPIEVTFRLY